MNLQELRAWHAAQEVRLRNQQRRHEDIAASWLSANKHAGFNHRAMSERSLKVALKYQRQADFHKSCVEAFAMEEK